MVLCTQLYAGIAAALPKSGRCAAVLAAINRCIEPGETAVQAAIRETQEELGLNITASQLHYCTELTVAITADFNVHKHLFWCQIDQQPLQVNPHEHDWAAWFKAADVAKQLYWASNQQTWQMVQEAIWR